MIEDLVILFTGLAVGMFIMLDTPTIETRSTKHPTNVIIDPED